MTMNFVLFINTVLWVHNLGYLYGILTGGMY